MLCVGLAIACLCLFLLFCKLFMFVCLLCFCLFCCVSFDDRFVYAMYPVSNVVFVCRLLLLLGLLFWFICVCLCLCLLFLFLPRLFVYVCVFSCLR